MNAVLWFRRRAAEPEPRRSLIPSAVTALIALGAAAVCEAAVDERALRMTPARVSFVEGEVSFWRPGSGEWEAAQVNIPLAAGDALATENGRFEAQIGPRAFMRADSATQLRLQSQEPDFLQITVASGRVVLDLRELRPGTVMQIDTPNGKLTTSRDGYYRVDVEPESTRVSVRRAGLASVTPNGGQAVEAATGESVLIEGIGDGQLTIEAAPGFDEWDRWSYDRADALLAAPRSSSVAREVYGAEDLETNGTWRYENTYGRVWVPNSVPVGWAPYTYGRWLYDPYYGWSWADYASWGWAPYHYGRWVYPGYWAWAPGPVVVAPVYSPALVAFFGVPGFSVGVSFGLPYVSWVPLGWGEPLIPWWGPVGFVGTPCWWGWGGPKVVNNIIINNGDTITADRIHDYRNMRVPGGTTTVEKGRFTDPQLHQARLQNVRDSDLKPIAGKPPVDTASFDKGHAARAKSALREYPGRGSSSQPSRAAANEAANFNRQAKAKASGESTVLQKGAGRHDAYDAVRERSARGQGTDTLKQGTDTMKQAPGRRAREVTRDAESPPVPSKGAEGNRYDPVRERGGQTADAVKRAPAGQSRAVTRNSSPPPLPSKGAVPRRYETQTRQRSTAGDGSLKQSAPSRSGSRQLQRSQAPPPLPSKSGRSAGAYTRSASPPSARRHASAPPRYENPQAVKPSYSSRSAPRAVPRYTERSGSGTEAKPAPAPSARYSNPWRSAPAPSARSSGSVQRAPSQGFGGMKSAPSMGRSMGGGMGGRTVSRGGGGGGMGAARNFSR
jgi:hypothetical protein